MSPVGDTHPAVRVWCCGGVGRGRAVGTGRAESGWAFEPFVAGCSWLAGGGGWGRPTQRVSACGRVVRRPHVGEWRPGSHPCSCSHRETLHVMCVTVLGGCDPIRGYGPRRAVEVLPASCQPWATQPLGSARTTLRGRSTNRCGVSESAGPARAAVVFGFERSHSASFREGRLAATSGRGRISACC